MKSRFDYRLGVPATKDEWSTFMVGIGSTFAIAWAGAGFVVLSWAGLTADGLRASFVELNLGAGACAFVIGGVLFWKLDGDFKGVRDAVGRAVRAMVGGVAAFVSFEAGVFLGVLGLCVSGVVLAPGPLGAPPTGLALELVWNLLSPLLVVVVLGAFCGWRKVAAQRQAREPA